MLSRAWMWSRTCQLAGMLWSAERARSFSQTGFMEWGSAKKEPTPAVPVLVMPPRTRMRVPEGDCIIQMRP